jgi:hypothetical protein
MDMDEDVLGLAMLMGSEPDMAAFGMGRSAALAGRLMARAFIEDPRVESSMDEIDGVSAVVAEHQSVVSSDLGNSSSSKLSLSAMTLN